ncbi:biotin synthase [Aquabacterium sp.]|uniref:biotin synthase n=1 Tax=Aquabacterium sp. TaxID=1872578 RepID=UPI0035B0A1AB
MSDTAPDTIPAVAPQAEAVQYQLRRLAHQSEVAWLNQEVARRLGSKLEMIKLVPSDWVHWNAWLGGGEEVVRARYPEARRWVVEPTATLTQRSIERERQAAPRAWWAPWRRNEQPVVESGAPMPPAWPASGANMLWANMTLHGATDLPGMLGQWSRLLAVDGFLMCSGLGPDTARELRALYAELGWPLPTVDFIDMHDLGDALVAVGFADPVMDMERLTLTWATAEELLAELRTWGGNVAWGRFQGLRTPRWKRRLLEALSTHLRREDGRLGLTIELVYGHAIKPVPRVKVEAEARVSVDDMRQMIRQGGKPGPR